jgi:hypothetical protein
MNIVILAYTGSEKNSAVYIVEMASKIADRKVIFLAS